MPSLPSTWQDIRALRAKQINLAAEDDLRGDTFAAALRQAEELAFSATEAGYASKALPLFYSLNQASRAITAARLPGSWQSFGHGLGVHADSSRPLLATKIKLAQNPGLYQAVSDAVGTPVLSAPTELGAVWAANPDLLSIPIPETAGTWPKAIEIPIGIQGGIMASSMDPEGSVETGGLVVMGVEMFGQTGQEVIDLLQYYPTLKDAFPADSDSSGFFPIAPDDAVERIPGGRINIAKKIAPTVANKEHWKVQRDFASVLVETWMPGMPSPNLTGYALPEIGGGPSPDPLMLWWMLLIGLSSLTRYHPALWTKEIDPDESELAVSLERVLDLAAEDVPRRVLAALKG